MFERDTYILSLQEFHHLTSLEIMKLLNKSRKKDDQLGIDAVRQMLFRAKRRKYKK